MSITREPRAVFQPDVVVVGAGLIGLTCATAVAREGLRVLVISSREEGSASAASAGILAPSVGDTPRPARTLALTARDMYPGYAQALTARTGVPVPLKLTGVVEIARDETEAAEVRSSLAENGEWLDVGALRDIEPALGPAIGGTFHAGDGSVDAVALLNAVTVDARRDPRVRVREERVTRICPAGRAIGVELGTGARVEAPSVVIAAGAWAGVIAGLPRPLPILPVRGQMLSFAGNPPRHVVMSPRGYVVPRGTQALVGSTMEQVGFDARPTAEGEAQLRGLAAELFPPLGATPVSSHWAGLRPVTPDALPLLGPDPDCEGLFYACGHSRNGVLLAPLTASVIGALVSTGTTAIETAPYSPARFGAASR